VIIQKGLVGKFLWHPNTYATDLMVARFKAYVGDYPVHSASDVLHSAHGFLNISFGRRSGHSTAIKRYIEQHPDTECVVISDRANFLHTRNLRNFVSLKMLDFLRGRSPDVIFVDVGYRSFMDYLSAITTALAPFRDYGVKVITTVSDGLETHNWKDPVLVEVGGPLSVLTQLGCDGYDIESKYRKENYQPS